MTASVAATTKPITPAAIRLRVRDAAAGARVVDVAVANEAEAIRWAAARGLHVVAVERNAASGAPESGGRFALTLFCQELLSLLDAGLNLTEALETLHAKERNAASRAVVAALLHELRQGRSFSDALQSAGGRFPEVFVATVRAAERTGDLPAALSRYVTYQLQFESIRKKLVAVSIYPVMLLAIGALVTLFLLGYVVPKFSAVYETAGRELPWMSALLLAVGRWIHAHWALALALFVAGCALAAWASTRPAVRAGLLARALRLPWVGAKADEFRLARFYRGLGLLLESGIPLARAMEMVQGLLGAGQRARLQAARRAIGEGRSLSLALQEAGLATSVADSMIRVGERSGQLAPMLERAARFHDEDFGRWVDWMSRVMEPLLMLVIGAVIGTVVVLMYMPIFELAGSLR